MTNRVDIYLRTSTQHIFNRAAPNREDVLLRRIVDLKKKRTTRQCPAPEPPAFEKGHVFDKKNAPARQLSPREPPASKKGLIFWRTTNAPARQCSAPDPPAIQENTSRRKLKKNSKRNRRREEETQEAEKQQKKSRVGYPSRPRNLICED